MRRLRGDKGYAGRKGAAHEHLLAVAHQNGHIAGVEPVLIVNDIHRAAFQSRDGDADGVAEEAPWHLNLNEGAGTGRLGLTGVEAGEYVDAASGAVDVGGDAVDGGGVAERLVTDPPDDGDFAALDSA